MKPLYGHNSQETAYLVKDYPYGFTLRCEILFFLEENRRGYRFVSITRNPKTGLLNKPKCSTYVRFAACMYLDHENKVQWSGISEYTNVNEIVKFLSDFPEASFHKDFKKFVLAQIAIEQNTVEVQLWKNVYDKLYGM
jgi:hypothetical protein